jgi:hypothetical protein
LGTSTVNSSPPEARDQQRLDHRIGQPVGHGPQHLVAELVAQGVVHQLEPVQVEEQHPDVAVLGRLSQPFGEHGPVG